MAVAAGKSVPVDGAAAGGAAGVAGTFPQSHRDIVVGFTGIGMSF